MKLRWNILQPPTKHSVLLPAVSSVLSELRHVWNWSRIKFNRRGDNTDNVDGTQEDLYIQMSLYCKNITAVLQVMPLQRKLFSALPIFQAKFFHLPFCSNACSYILTEYDLNFMRNVVALIIQEFTVPAVAAVRQILAVFWFDLTWDGTPSLLLTCFIL